MNIKTLGKLQILTGVLVLIHIVFWQIFGNIGGDEVYSFFYLDFLSYAFGIYAIITGSYNVKAKK